MAAGILLVLTPWVTGIEDGPLKLFGVLLVATVMIGCTLIFIEGCLHKIRNHLQYPPGKRGG